MRTTDNHTPAGRSGGIEAGTRWRPVRFVESIRDNFLKSEVLANGGVHHRQTCSETLLQCLGRAYIDRQFSADQNSTMPISSNLEHLKNLLRENKCTPTRVCSEIASLFCVATSAVGLLQLEGRILTFLFPPELRAAGSIPLSSSAIAARTAMSRTAECFNNFAQVRHHSIFEFIKIGNEPNASSQVIQKLMSAPVIGAEEVLGVLQVSRKGVSPGAAGPDFDAGDLARLEEAAKEIGKVMPNIVGNTTVSKPKLTFHP